MQAESREEMLYPISARSCKKGATELLRGYKSAVPRHPTLPDDSIRSEFNRCDPVITCYGNRTLQGLHRRSGLSLLSISAL